MNALKPIDIVQRLLRRKPIWLEGPPKIFLEGEEGSFGELSFVFEEDGREIKVSYRIRIKSRELILKIAREAIENFRELAELELEIRADSGECDLL